MDAIERYEKMAAQFKKETGLLAPGKDAPAAVAGCPEYDIDHRRKEWDKWIASHCTLTQMLWDRLSDSDEVLGEDYKALEGSIEIIKGTFKTVQYTRGWWGGKICLWEIILRDLPHTQSNNPISYLVESKRCQREKPIKQRQEGERCGGAFVTWFYLFHHLFSPLSGVTCLI